MQTPQSIGQMINRTDRTAAGKKNINVKCFSRHLPITPPPLNRACYPCQLCVCGTKAQWCRGKLPRRADGIDSACGSREDQINTTMYQLLASRTACTASAVSLAASSGELMLPASMAFTFSATIFASSPRKGTAT